MGLRESIILTGSRSDIPDVLGMLDVFVLSSYTEGLSITLLEAMAAGLPIVATDVGGNPSVVVHNETGIIVPPRDSEELAEALRRMLSDRAAATRMGRRGQERVVEEYGLRRMVNRYEDVYEELVR